MRLDEWKKSIIVVAVECADLQKREIRARPKDACHHQCQLVCVMTVGMFEQYRRSIRPFELELAKEDVPRDFLSIHDRRALSVAHILFAG